MSRLPRPRRVLVVLLAALAALPAATAAAADDDPFALLSKASPDECFATIGDPWQAMPPDGTCPAGRRPKTNQAYVWGLTKHGSDLFFGTAANVQCLVEGTFLGVTTPSESPSAVCEFGQSSWRTLFAPTIPAAVGDFRPPVMYRYDLKDGTLHDLTGQWSGADAVRLRQTIGIRAAASLGKTVLMAGPSLAGGINVFAFDDTGALIGSKNLLAYSNIRRFVTVGGRLYTAVGKTGGGGALLRWTPDGTDPGTPGSPATGVFDFAVVGTTPSEGADLAEHEGRVFVATWPQTGVKAGLFMSPPVPDAGLPADTTPLTKVWGADDYEPDPVTAATYGGGALASYGGKLIWGTMHVPFTGTLAHLNAYAADYPGGPTTADTLAAITGTWRAVAVFSGEHFGTPEQKITLLYGSQQLPVYVPGGGGWTTAPNKMGGAAPLLGQSGFGNRFNNYTWSMATAGNRLYVGTMDWSRLFSEALDGLSATLGLPITLSDLNLQFGNWGADLMRFTSPTIPATPVDRSGLGNDYNYGIRTMVGSDKTLYLGTANPMNLAADPVTEKPLGGWELRRFGPAETFPAPPTPPVPEEPAPDVTAQSPPPTSPPAPKPRCSSTRRFTMRLGLRVRLADHRRMGIVKSATAALDGVAVTVRRTSQGLTIPVDLRRSSTKFARLKVVMTLAKPVRVRRVDGGWVTTNQVTRTYRFTVC